LRLAKENRLFAGIFLFIILFVVGCTGARNKNIDKLAKIYARLTFVSRLYSGKPDSIKAKRKSIFNEFGITEKEYYSQLKKITPEEESWKRFFKLAKEELNKIQKNNK